MKLTNLINQRILICLKCQPLFFPPASKPPTFQAPPPPLPSSPSSPKLSSFFPFTTTHPLSFTSSFNKPMDPPSPNSPQTIPVVSTVTSPFESSPSPLIDATSSLRKPLSLWPGMYHSPVTNALWEARSSIFEHLLDPSKDGPPQMELLTKTPSQSRTSIHYNFSGDYILREQYRDPWNEVRIGKLLEDLDALAGTIAVKAGALVLIYWNYWHVCKCSTAIPHLDSIEISYLSARSCRFN